MSLSQKEKAERFRELHQGARILVLPNVWDVTSARIVEEAGFPAVATSSSAVAATLGYRDGQRISGEEMLGVVERIARAVAVPVSADLEAGYGNTPRDMEEITRRLLAAGAVGLNIEDSKTPEHSLLPIPAQVEKLRAMRATADRAGIPLVINARVDTYLRGFGDPESRFAETLKRARAYREAGADCIFPITLTEASKIQRMVSEVNWPMNILAGPGALSIPELEALGVARASFASGLLRAALGALRQVVSELRETGTYNQLGAGLTSAELKQLLPHHD